MRKPLWWVKLKFEYWPWWAFYLTLMPLLLWQIIRTRCWTFFTAANPGMDDTSGAMGETKDHILGQFPARFLPAQVLVPANASVATATALMQHAGIAFPAVAKPNVGERGILVHKLLAPEDLTGFMNNFSKAFLIQAFITEPEEYAVFYVRLPNSPTGRVTSITAKKFLSVTGDGTSTIRELMQRNDRARMQIDRLAALGTPNLAGVLPAGESLVLEPIGNHNRGTAFLDACHLITPAVHRAFDEVSGHMAGFHYGRYDLKVRTAGDLHTLNHLKIMELNGVGAEPGHIYAPEGNFFRAWWVVAQHWQLLGTIAMQQRKQGVPVVPLGEFVRRMRQHLRTRGAGH